MGHKLTKYLENNGTDQSGCLGQAIGGSEPANQGF